jgi:hypothetical protein
MSIVARLPGPIIGVGGIEIIKVRPIANPFILTRGKMSTEATAFHRFPQQLRPITILLIQHFGNGCCRARIGMFRSQAAEGRIKQ